MRKTNLPSSICILSDNRESVQALKQKHQICILGIRHTRKY